VDGGSEPLPGLVVDLTAGSVVVACKRKCRHTYTAFKSFIPTGHYLHI
jgi:hypothetical protein